MSTEQNKKVVLRWREERNKGNWSIIDELHALDYVGHISFVPGGAIRGRAALKQLFIGYWAAFDVYAMSEPDLLIAEGDLVAHRETVHIKHKGMFQGIPQQGKKRPLQAWTSSGLWTARLWNSGPNRTCSA